MYTISSYIQAALGKKAQGNAAFKVKNYALAEGYYRQVVEHLPASHLAS